MTSFSAAERECVVRDIAHWKVELEHTGGRAFSDEEYDTYVETLQSLSDEDLESWWMGSVGEWVASRQDIDVPADKPFDDWLAEQFNRLTAGESVPWGYVVSITL